MASNESSTPTLKAPWPTPTGNLTTYDLHCHCGAIRYKIKLDPPLYISDIPPNSNIEQYPVVECHCSHCQRHGGLMVHPLMQNIQFAPGWEEQRGVHLSGSRKNPHFYCKHCGCFVATDLTYMMTEVFGGENRMAINLRMLKDCDLSKLKIVQSHMMDDVDPKYEI